MKTRIPFRHLFVSTVLATLMGMSQIIFAAPGRPKAVVRSSFWQVAKHLDLGGSSFTYRSNEGMGDMMEGLLSMFETIAKSEGDPQTMAVLKVVQDIYEESGYKGISGTGSSIFEMENGIARNLSMIHHWPGQDKGLLWKLMGGQAHVLDGLKLMPASTTLAMHGDLDVAAGWAWLKAFMAKQDPAMARQFNATLLEIASNNIPVDELLGSLGGELGMSVVLHPSKTVKFPMGQEFKNGAFVPQTIELPEPGLVLAVKVKNDLLLNMVGSMLVAQGAESKKMNGVELMILEAPPGATPFPLSPTVMKTGDYLVFASTQELAKEVLSIQSGQSKGLVGTADFQKMTAGMELKGNHLFYLSPLVRELGLKLVEDALAKEREFQNPQARAAMMKLVNVGAAYLSHQVVLGKRLPNGLLVDNRATGAGLMSGGVGGTGTVATVGILASMLLPALAKAKAKANAIKSVNNAKILWSGLHGYASENGGRLPLANQWCDAVLREVLTEKVFVSPQDPTAGARMEAGQKFSSYALNAAVAGKNLNELAHDTVLVFECPVGWNGTGGLADINLALARPGNYRNLSTIAVTMVDGSSRQVTLGRLDGLNWTGRKR